MGAKCSRTDYEWSYTDEPHATRRRIILEKHPEIKQLFGTDPAFVYVVVAMVITQVIACYLLKDSDWLLIFLQAYLFGGTMNHSLTLAVHEISHNLAYGHSNPLKNRFMGMIANLPIGVPMSVSFKKYHLEHHRYMGEDVLDTDIPTRLEGYLFSRTWTKIIWLSLQPIFYCFRPMIVYRKAPTDLEFVNLLVQLGFDAAVYYFWGWKPLAYLLFGTFISLGLHPTAGHFIAEHYIFKPGQETYSYTGILNLVTFNVGYHVEHHDFPSIPGHKLPLVRKMAPEFYDHLETHTSWLWVLWQFVVNPAIGPYARVKRPIHHTPEHGAQNALGEYFDAFLQYAGYYELEAFVKRSIGMKKPNLMKSANGKVLDSDRKVD